MQKLKELKKSGFIEAFYWLLDNKEYAAWLFFGFMGVGLFFRKEHDWIFLSALLGYLAAITALIVKTHKNSEKKAKIFDSLQDANTVIHEEIETAIQGKSCEILWLGVTMQSAWLNLENCLGGPVKRSRVRKLTLNLLQSSPETLRAILKDEEFAEITEKQYLVIVRFCEQNKDTLSSTGSKISIAQYPHMPNYHGVLINRKTLFISNVRWEEETEYTTLSVPHEPFERYDSSEPRGDYMIKLFVSWFEKSAQTAAKNYQSDQDNLGMVAASLPVDPAPSPV